MKKIIVFFLYLCLTPLIWAAEQYDFDKLLMNASTEKGPFIVSGAAQNATEALSRFAEIDSLRADEYIRRARAPSSEMSVSSSSSSSSSSDKKSPLAASQKTFVCKIYCESASGPVIYRDFSAADRSDAARQAADVVHKACKSSGFSKASNVRFDPAQCSAK